MSGRAARALRSGTTKRAVDLVVAGSAMILLSPLILLWNVGRGHMSVVGSRPLLMAHQTRYTPGINAADNETMPEYLGPDRPATTGGST